MIINMKPLAYVDFRMREWHIDQQPRRIQSLFRKVLGELVAEASLFLKDPRLEVRVIEESYGCGAIWAYFPIHRRRLIARHLNTRSETRVLLVISLASCHGVPVKTLEDYLRDALGHVLLYLQNPKAPNECSDAMKEWRALRVARPRKA